MLGMVVEGISKSMANVLGKNARRRGLTVEAYLKQLIAEDIELEREARTKTFAELAIPFQKSIECLSESDLDALARPRLAKNKTKPGKINRSKTNGKKLR